MSHPGTDVTARESLDRKMMTRCIEVAVRSGQAGEYPYGVVICRAGVVVAESINRVAHERDVTRHAEIVAISQAQKALATVSLDDCTIYVSAEPCVYCCYAIRESRMCRLVYALRSPHMGGVSKWNVLTDRDLSDKMPEVFDPPPEIVAGFMAREAERALLAWNPVVFGIILQRGLFTVGPLKTVNMRKPVSDPERKLMHQVMAFLRRTVFDRFGRGANAQESKKEPRR
jgi:tRNA(adenine34) deaminase